MRSSVVFWLCLGSIPLTMTLSLFLYPSPSLPPSLPSPLPSRSLTRERVPPESKQPSSRNPGLSLSLSLALPCTTRNCIAAASTGLAASNCITPRVPGRNSRSCRPEATRPTPDDFQSSESPLGREERGARALLGRTARGVPRAAGGDGGADRSFPVFLVLQLQSTCRERERGLGHPGNCSRQLR